MPRVCRANLLREGRGYGGSILAGGLCHRCAATQPLPYQVVACIDLDVVLLPPLCLIKILKKPLAGLTQLHDLNFFVCLGFHPHSIAF